MSVELTVIVKDDERKLQKDYLVYESFVMSETDETLKKYVNDAIKEFVGEPTDIKVKALLMMG